jgi:hypothetical protein
MYSSGGKPIVIQSAMLATSYSMKRILAVSSGFLLLEADVLNFCAREFTLKKSGASSTYYTIFSTFCQAEKSEKSEKS